MDPTFRIRKRRGHYPTAAAEKVAILFEGLLCAGLPE